jgi:hypothetical protein
MAYDPTTTTTAFTYEDGFQTTLSSGINATDLAIPLTTLPSGVEGTLVIEPGTASEEEIYYTSKGAGVVNVPSASAGRGVNGTATSHSAGVTVKMLVSKAMLDAIKKGEFGGANGVNVEITSGTDAGVDVHVNSSSATNNAVYARTGSFAHSGALVKSETINATDTGSLFLAKNNGTGYSVEIQDGAGTVGAGWDKNGIQTIGPAWTSWTPTWANITLGNAVQTSAYQRIGRFIYFRAALEFGSTTSVTGSPTITYPVTPINYRTTTTSNVVTIGTVNYRDATGSQHTGSAAFNSTTVMGLTTIRVSGADATYAAVSSTVPFTWAQNDGIYIQGFYEAAA